MCCGKFLLSVARSRAPHSSLICDYFSVFVAWISDGIKFPNKQHSNRNMISTHTHWRVDVPLSVYRCVLSYLNVSTSEQCASVYVIQANDKAANSKANRVKLSWIATQTNYTLHKLTGNQIHGTICLCVCVNKALYTSTITWPRSRTRHTFHSQFFANECKERWKRKQKREREKKQLTITAN